MTAPIPGAAGPASEPLADLEREGSAWTAPEIAQLTAVRPRTRRGQRRDTA